MYRVEGEDWSGRGMGGMWEAEWLIAKEMLFEFLTSTRNWMEQKRLLVTPNLMRLEVGGARGKGSG